MFCHSEAQPKNLSGGILRYAHDDTRRAQDDTRNGETVHYRDPEINGWHRFLFGLVGLLPIEELT